MWKGVNNITDLTKYILTPFTWLVERLTSFFMYTTRDRSATEGDGSQIVAFENATI